MQSFTLVHIPVYAHFAVQYENILVQPPLWFLSIEINVVLSDPHNVHSCGLPYFIQVTLRLYSCCYMLHTPLFVDVICFWRIITNTKWISQEGL